MDRENPNLVWPYSETLLPRLLTEKLKYLKPKRTHKEIAHDVGLKTKTLKKILRGEIRIPFEIVPSLAETLGISVIWLARLAIDQYWRGREVPVDEVLGRTASLNEEEIFLNKWREATRGDDPRENPTINNAVDEMLRKLFPKIGRRR